MHTKLIQWGGGGAKISLRYVICGQPHKVHGKLISSINEVNVDYVATCL